MNGLQAIMDRILSEAQEKAGQITEQTQNQCAEILETAKFESDQLLTAARQNAAAQAEALLNRASSSAMLQSRKTMLQMHQDLIDQAIAGSIELLCRQTDQEKIALYRQLLQETGAKSGEITLALKDQHLAGALLEDAAGHFLVADIAGHFSGGLVLRRDLIEDNLTFERLAATSRPELVRLAAAVLAGSLDADQASL